MPVINLDYFFYLPYKFFSFLWRAIYDPQSLIQFQAEANKIWYVFLVISIILLAGVIYFLFKLQRNWREEYERVYGQPGIIAEIKEDLAIAPPPQNETWQKILKLSGSDNPNDWKQAIIEADKVLDLIVANFAVAGDNLGEKMKNIEKGDFLTLEEAWQAHKVRNQIAHEQNFHLSQREARRAIDNYEKVFQEFDFI